MQWMQYQRPAAINGRVLGFICLAAWAFQPELLLGQTPAPSLIPPRQMLAQQVMPLNYPYSYPSTADLPNSDFALAPPTNRYSISSGNEALGLSTTEPTVPATSQPLDTSTFVERSLIGEEPWSWQLLPPGFMYKSYLAGNRESRFAAQWVHQRGYGWLWDFALGGKAGLLRFGSTDAWRPEGWQLDIEGAAYPRIDLENDRDLVSADFRFGIPLTVRRGPWEAKFGSYHLSSHLGDEYMLRYPGCSRINYVWDGLVLGLAVNLNPNLRVYSEAGWAFSSDGGCKPWQFQFGADFSPAEPTGPGGAPFLAVNTHLREENDFGGNFTLQTGWQWRGRGGPLLRFGLQYFNGFSEQAQFYQTFEELIGLGLWYDY